MALQHGRRQRVVDHSVNSSHLKPSLDVDQMEVLASEVVPMAEDVVELLTVEVGQTLAVSGQLFVELDVSVLVLLVMMAKLAIPLPRVIHLLHPSCRRPCYPMG